MTKEEFIKQVTEIADRWCRNYPDLRRGQAIFNFVDENFGSVARKVQHSDNVDCFYDDDLIDEFFDHCWEYMKDWKW
jgi:hypothetical protein